MFLLSSPKSLTGTKEIHELWPAPSCAARAPWARKMGRFRPCIDLHNGQVKQIVGGTLTDAGPGPVTNFEADQGAAHFADLYRQVGERRARPRFVVGRDG